jgi:thymidylate synthase
MIVFEGVSADAVWRQAVRRLQAVEAVQESRDQATRELLHAAFTLTDPRQRVVFGRPINPAFAVAEVIWILSGANDVDFLRFWNPRMVRFTDEDEHRFHGAYGFRLGSQPRLSAAAAARLRHTTGAVEPRLDQLQAAREVLSHTPHSRQVILQIWDGRLDLPDPAPRSRDIPCNIVSHLLLREGKLEWLQVMRSNDLIWGTPYNFIQWTTLQEIVAGWLGAEVGTYTHISDSLHVYERHWQELAAIGPAESEQPRNSGDLRIAPYDAWEALWARLVDGALALTDLHTAEDLLAVQSGLDDLPPAYREWVALLTAEALRRRGFAAQASETIAGAGPFWGASWRQWAASLAGPRD